MRYLLTGDTGILVPGKKFEKLGNYQFNQIEESMKRVIIGELDIYYLFGGIHMTTDPGACFFTGEI